MKGINWKVRFKKKSFWVAIVSAILLFVNNITQALGLNYTEQLEQFSDGINGLLAVLVTFGVIQDPTTKGLKDSGITQTYTKPRDENIDPVEYQKKVDDDSVTPERQELTPKEYDTSEPFTDDSDEVEFDVADYEYDEELKRGASRYHDDEVLKESEKDGSEHDRETSD
ncbi:phage holin [Staphylococcus pettenkoferi]|uniref:Phage holin n=2 Tax=Staphylococcus pettenkoferi TaxID=170573 RepID=A0ABT4BND2_9STAP|nr:phage holin [Staphylococcus pettenkoferi]MCY1584129.1 phage holin [Staphylococcus pettenkoferi]